MVHPRARVGTFHHLSRLSFLSGLLVSGGYWLLLALLALAPEVDGPPAFALLALAPNEPILFALLVFAFTRARLCHLCHPGLVRVREVVRSVRLSDTAGETVSPACVRVCSLCGAHRCRTVPLATGKTAGF